MKRKCDNPDCTVEALPEETKPYIPPYRWIQIKSGRIIGEMNIKNLEVCSLACLEPAIQAELEKRADR